MLDKERVLMKVDELRGYLEELRVVKPQDFNQYQKIEKKRSCERLLQLAIESIIDICKIIVSTLRLGVPGEENDLFNKLFKKKIIDRGMFDLLKKMRGFRNILIHEYAEVDDEIVFKTISSGLDDFDKFIGIILGFLKSGRE